MPLDTRKLKHIAAKLTPITQGRTQQITLVLRNPDGTTQTIQKPAIWRQAQDADPTLNPPSGSVPGSPHTGGVEDIVSLFNQTDISLSQLRSCIYAYPTSPLSSEPANRYLLTSVTPKGMQPGGDRFIVTWTRQR
jgi:hypothetical protein